MEASLGEKTWPCLAGAEPERNGPTGEAGNAGQEWTGGEGGSEQAPACPRCRRADVPAMPRAQKRACQLLKHPQPWRPRGHLINARGAHRADLDINGVHCMSTGGSARERSKVKTRPGGGGQESPAERALEQQAEEPPEI